MVIDGKVPQRPAALLLHVRDLWVPTHRPHNGFDSARLGNLGLVSVNDGEVPQRPAALLLHVRDLWVPTHRPHHGFDSDRLGNLGPVLVIDGKVPQRPAALLLHVRAGVLCAHRFEDGVDLGQKCFLFRVQVMGRYKPSPHRKLDRSASDPELFAKKVLLQSLLLVFNLSMLIKVPFTPTLEPPGHGAFLP